MRFALPALVIAAALGATNVSTAQPPAEQHQHPPAGGAGMSGMMPPGMTHGGVCFAMSDERLGALKRDLGITAGQTPRWNAFAEAVRTNAREMGPMTGGMGRMGAGGGHMASMSLPQRLDLHERMMAQHLEALRRVKAPLLALYNSFTPDQKAKADAMCGHGQKAPAH